MKKYILSTLVAAMTLAGLGQQVFAASTTGDAVQVVTEAISITNVSDLDFGTAVQGDASKTVAPGAVENAENGSFNVVGNPSATYTITLPASTSMITGGGGANETIAVNTFLSFPAAGANGVLSGAGTQLLLVGATRAALGAAQVPGNYTGAYTVTVVY